MSILMIRSGRCPDHSVEQLNIINDYDEDEDDADDADGDLETCAPHQ